MQQAGTTLPQGPIRHVCFVEQAEIECDVLPLLNAIVAQSWPTSIRLVACSMPQPPAATRTASPNGIQRLTYYENVKHAMDARHGADPEKWPHVLRFARMTRNAFGHGGTLDIRISRATSSWRGLTLSYANNGEQMLYNHLASGDVILLMLDIEDLL
jgi:hypothetical protein